MSEITVKMFSIRWLPAISAALALLSAPVFAVDPKMQMNGASFSTACTRPDEIWVSFCNGYIQAVIDNIREADHICLPKGTTRSDIVTVAEKEITESSQLRAMNGHDAVLSVLRRFYTCR